MTEFIPLFLVQVFHLIPSRTESALSAALLTEGCCPVLDKHMENILLPNFQPISTQLIQLFLILRLMTICKKHFNSLLNFPKQHNFPLFPFHLMFAVWTTGENLVLQLYLLPTLCLIYSLHGCHPVGRTNTTFSWEGSWVSFPAASHCYTWAPFQP